MTEPRWPKIRDLIERIKKSPRGDRTIDAEIHCLEYPDRITHPALPVGFTMLDRGKKHENEALARSAFVTRTRAPAPRYTSNMADAISLIPKHGPAAPEGFYKYDFTFSVGHTNGGMTIHACVGSKTEHFADSVELAFCLAYLEFVLAEELPPKED